MPIDLSFCVRNKSQLSLSSNKGSTGSRGWGWPSPPPNTRIRFAWIRGEKQRQNSFCNCVDRTNAPNHAPPPWPLICPHLLATLRLLQMHKLFHIAAKKEINYRSRSHSRSVSVSRSRAWRHFYKNAVIEGKNILRVKFPIEMRENEKKKKNWIRNKTKRSESKHLSQPHMICLYPNGTNPQVRL